MHIRIGFTGAQLAPPDFSQLPGALAERNVRATNVSDHLPTATLDEHVGLAPSDCGDLQHSLRPRAVSRMARGAPVKESWRTHGYAASLVVMEDQESLPPWPSPDGDYDRAMRPPRHRYSLGGLIVALISGAGAGLLGGGLVEHRTSQIWIGAPVVVLGLITSVILRRRQDSRIVERPHP